MKSKRKQRSRRKNQRKAVEQEQGRTCDFVELQQEMIVECEKHTALGTETGEQTKQARTHDLEELQQETILNVACRIEIDEYGAWSELPVDLVELIALHLFRMDFAHLTHVCKRWRSIGPLSLFMKRNPLTLTNPDMPLLRNHSPWLMFSQKEDDGMYTLWDPLCNKSHIVNIPQQLSMGSSRLCFSKDGWVFMDDRNGLVSLFNPFIREEIRLPFFQSSRKVDIVGISTTPTSSNSVICVFTGGSNETTEVHVCRHGDSEWINYIFENNLLFVPSYANPVFMDEVVYVLGHDGKLGIFDPDHLTWEVLAKPKPLKYCNCKLFPICRWENYLVEWKGELLMVFVGFLGTEVHVYRLDSSAMEWIKIESLAECMLFIGRWSCISCTAMVEGMANKIHFPRRSGEEGVFYSLKDQRCYPKPDFYDSEEYINCTWVEPRWFRPPANELLAWS